MLQNAALLLAMFMLTVFSPFALQARGANEQETHAVQGHGETGQDTAEHGEVKSGAVVDLDLTLFTLLVFVILAIVLKRFAWKPIMDSLEKREHVISDQIASAERNHADSKKLLAEYEQRLAGAANEVRAMMEEARRDAEHAKQSILTEAKAGADAERARAVHDIEAATDAALESLAERSAQLAVDLAGKILQSKLSPADHSKLIQDAMAKFPTASAN